MRPRALPRRIPPFHGDDGTPPLGEPEDLPYLLKLHGLLLRRVEGSFVIFPQTGHGPDVPDEAVAGTQRLPHGGSLERLLWWPVERLRRSEHAVCTVRAKERLIGPGGVGIVGSG